MFDSHCVAEGCGITIGHAGGVRVQRVQKVQRVQRVQRVVVAAPPQFYNRRRRHILAP